MKVLDRITGLTLKSDNGIVVRFWRENRERYREVTAGSADLSMEDMSVERLKAFAAEREIDIGRLRSTEKIIAIIKDALI